MLRFASPRWMLCVRFGGCVTGKLRDAATNGPVVGAAVFGIGQCSGLGCTNTESAHVTTGSDGSFGFDTVTLKPAAGDEALRVLWVPPIGVNWPGNGWYYLNPGSYTSTEIPPVLAGPWGAPDVDQDGLDAIQEAAAGTSDTDPDTDHDGITDYTEIFGANGLDLAHYGADPLVPDVFVECDWAPGWKPLPESIARVGAAFAAAPTPINLHVLLDEELPANAGFDTIGTLGGTWADYDADWTSLLQNHRSDVRADFFHYCVFTKDFDEGDHGHYSGVSDEIPYDHFIVSLGAAFCPGNKNNTTSPAYQQCTEFPATTPNGTPITTELRARWEGNTFMHELGHNLGLQHGGDEGHNCKPNYISVMNYLYQFEMRHLDSHGVADSNFLDYSRWRLAPLDEGDASVVTSQNFNPYTFPSEADAIDEIAGLGTQDTDPQAASVTEADLAAYPAKVVKVVYISFSGVKVPSFTSCIGDGQYVWLDDAVNANVNWNQNHANGQPVIEASPYVFNIDGIGDPMDHTSYSVLHSYNDWHNIIFTGNAGSLGDTGAQVGAVLPINLPIGQPLRQDCVSQLPPGIDDAMWARLCQRADTVVGRPAARALRAQIASEFPAPVSGDSCMSRATAWSVLGFSGGLP